MRWGWVRAFPKYVLVFVLVVGSTAAFGAWWSGVGVACGAE